MKLDITIKWHNWEIKWSISWKHENSKVYGWRVQIVWSSLPAATSIQEFSGWLNKQQMVSWKEIAVSEEENDKYEKLHIDYVG